MKKERRVGRVKPFLVLAMGLVLCGFLVRGGGTGTPAGYIGPGDITTFTAWWGLRPFTQAKANAGASTVAVGVVRGNTTSTNCTFYLKGDGTSALDLATGTPCNSNTETVTHFCTVSNSSCSIHQMFDQTGNGWDLTGSSDPAFVFSCNGSLPCLEATVNGQKLIAGSNITPATGVASFSFVAKTAANTDTTFVAENGVNNFVETRSSDGNVLLVGGSINWVVVPWSQNTWHAFNGMVNCNACTSTANVDGTETSGNIPTTTDSTVASTPLILTPTNASVDEKWFEAGFIDNVAWGGTTRTTLCQNQNAHITLPGGC